MNLLDHMLASAGQAEVAEHLRTVYWLDGHVIHPDEVFAADGFMPLIGRRAERRAQRILKAKGQIGFQYLPARHALLGEILNIDPTGPGLLPDATRSLLLVDAAKAVVGLGVEGAIDITPVFEYFVRLGNAARDALIDIDEQELESWPLFKPLSPKMAD